jgi:hypothetical protein
MESLPGNLTEKYSPSLFPQKLRADGVLIVTHGVLVQKQKVAFSMSSLPKFPKSVWDLGPWDCLKERSRWSLFQGITMEF